MAKRASFSRGSSPSGRSHDLARRMLAVDEGALEREIDEADGDAVLPDRDLAQQQRRARRALQERQRLAHAPRRGVDLVDEEEARDVGLLELAQHDLERRNLALVRLADDDRRVADRRDVAHVVQELDRAGAIDEGHALAEEIDASRRWARCSCEWARASALASPTLSPFADAAGAGDGSGALQDGFEQGGLAALKRADDRDASRARS